MNIQYGCGHCAPAGWMNFDASPSLFFTRLPLIGPGIQKTMGLPLFPVNVRFGDIVKGLPVPPESCDLVYCSHVLEHLALSDFRLALRNTYQYLKPGGVFRLVMPDLEMLAKAYVSSSNPDAAEIFLRQSSLGQVSRPRGIVERVKDQLGNSKHLWMWDYKALAGELAQAGFVDIRQACFGDSQYPAFEVVENRSRWDDALGAECRRSK